MISERIRRSRSTWLFALLASLLILALQLGGETSRQLLLYERTAIESGDWYRLLSCHWLHLDWTHAGMNIAGLWLLALIDTLNRGIGTQLCRSLFLCLAVGLLLYALEPQLQWYVGLSGVLHGLFIIVLLDMIHGRRDPLALAVLAVLIGKLAWEHYHGALTQDALSAQVIVSAHSFGALAGLGYSGTGILATRLMTRLGVTASRKH